MAIPGISVENIRVLVGSGQDRGEVVLDRSNRSFGSVGTMVAGWAELILHIGTFALRLEFVGHGVVHENKVDSNPLVLKPCKGAPKGSSDR